MKRRRLLLAATAVSVCVTGTAVALPGPLEDQAPVLSRETARGGHQLVSLDPVVPSAKTVDGDPSDWIGTATGFGGTIVRSAGELVYTDHLFDAHGADDGGDAERLAQLDPLVDAEPSLYRLDPLYQQDVAGEFGAPVPDEMRGEETYGDLGLQPTADLVEVRLAADAEWLYVLARTTTMQDPGDLRIRVVLDGVTHDLAAGTQDVAVDPTGWQNTLEARLPRPDGSTASIALGSVTPDGRVANVAFRTAEPVRVFFDHDQALGLFESGDVIDPFAIEVDLDELAAGATQRWVPGPGYHDRIFRSTETISEEKGENGVWQHYGLYLPDAWDPAAATAHPLQWWLHWRGGEAHTAGAVIPKLFRDLGDDHDTVVISPRGRGTSEWYVGVGHVDVLEVWDDVHALLAGRIDADRVYVTGHSMGGWGSWLLSILYPDRFAAAVPYAGPVTQGAWTGADVPGCDDLQFEEYTPCYIPANDSDPRAQHTQRMLENLRNVPVAAFHGAADELVPISGVTRQMARMAELGYRYRYYASPTYEHYTHPIMDQWEEGGRYSHQFVRDPNPPEVVYIRDVAFERTVEEIRSKGHDLDFAFDSAYWMTGLEVAPGADRAIFRGRNLGDPEAHLAVPDTAPPATVGQWGPFVVTGQQWVDSTDLTAPPARNGVALDLDGVSAVAVDVDRLGLDRWEPIVLEVTTTHPVTVTLAERSVQFDAGTSTVEVTAPRKGPKPAKRR